MGFGVCTGFSFWTSKIVIMFPGICKAIWYFLDVPGLFCVFPGVEVDVSWSCTVVFLEFFCSCSVVFSSCSVVVSRGVV